MPRWASGAPRWKSPSAAEPASPSSVRQKNPRLTALDLASSLTATAHTGALTANRPAGQCFPASQRTAWRGLFNRFNEVILQAKNTCFQLNAPTPCPPSAMSAPVRVSRHRVHAGCRANPALQGFAFAKRPGVLELAPAFRKPACWRKVCVESRAVTHPRPRSEEREQKPPACPGSKLPAPKLDQGPALQDASCTAALRALG